MSQEIIEDFRNGLDTRKFKLSAPAGTLTGAVDCHITPGGEIEKRKEFARNIGLTGTFGCVSLTGSTAMVFGSDDLAAGFPKAMFGKTVTYQRLQHPSILEGAVYDATKHAMTAIVDAKPFGDSAWAAARFSDGRTFGYYDGTPVYDFFDGLVLPNRNTNALIAAALQATVNRTSAYTATLNGTVIGLSGTKGNGFNEDVTITPTGSAGGITPLKQNDGQPGVDAVQAVGQFTIVQGEYGADVYDQGFLLGVFVNGVDITSLGASGNLSGAAVRTVSRARTGSIVTLVYGFAHGLKVGDIIQVSNLGGVSYNGIFSVTSVPDPVTFTYDCGVAATEGTTADVNGQVKMGGLNPLLANGVPNSIYPQTYVPWGTSNEATAAVCAAVINAMTAYSGYSAVATGNHVVITAQTASADLNNHQVGVATTSAFVCDNCAFACAGNTFSVQTIALNGVTITTLQHPFPSVQTSNYALTSNVATITTGTQHGLYVGDKVAIAGLTGTGVDLNGTWTVASVPTTTTFTFAYVHANITSAASVAGTVTVAATLRQFYDRLVRDINSAGLACAATDGKQLFVGRAYSTINTGGVGLEEAPGPGTSSDKTNVNVVVTFVDTNGVVTTDNSGTLSVKVSQKTLTVQPKKDGFGGISAATTGAVRCLAIGGVGPYSFGWSFVSGDDGFVINSPDSETTTFGTPAKKFAFGSTSTSLSATFACKVTDANGLTGFSPFVTVQVKLSTLT